MSDTDKQVTFDTRAPERRAGRYTLANAVPTDDGGRVAVGVDKRGESALVHELGHSQAGCPMHAVATAITSGKVIPLDAIARAFVAQGKAPALKKAIEKVEQGA